jgi:hypothetical protein
VLAAIPKQTAVMRPAWFLLPFALACSVVPAKAFELVRVWPGTRSAESFERISEYFTGRENTGGQTIVRSQPAERGGYYWLLRTRTPAALAGVTFELTYTAPHSAEPRTRLFHADLPAGRHVTLIGLTGTDWPELEAEPVTWRLRVLDAQGNELAHEASVLWTEPTR